MISLYSVRVYFKLFFWGQSCISAGRQKKPEPQLSQGWVLTKGKKEKSCYVNVT